MSKSKSSLCDDSQSQYRGYFVVAAAVLVKLKPEFALHQQLVPFVDTLIRDTTNPSAQEGIAKTGDTCKSSLRECQTSIRYSTENSTPR